MASPLPDQRAQASAEVPRRLFIPKKLTKRTRGIDFAHQGMSKGRALADACSFLRGTRSWRVRPALSASSQEAGAANTRARTRRSGFSRSDGIKFQSCFPDPAFMSEAPSRRRSNIAEKLAEKSALAMILGLYRSDNFRKPSLMPPPHVSSTIGRAPKRMRTDADGWTKTHQFYTPELGKSTARILRSGVSPITPRRPHAHASEISGLEAPTARRRTPKQPLPRPDKHPETAHSPQPQP